MSNLICTQKFMASKSVSANNIRTDRFDIAIEATDKIARAEIAAKNQVKSNDVPSKLEGGTPSEN